jgi:hypothetical protein
MKKYEKMRGILRGEKKTLTRMAFLGRSPSFEMTPQTVDQKNALGI